jgi:Tfp pilus assembly protein PilX
MIHPTQQRTPSMPVASDPQGRAPGPMANDNGSVMVLALMVMAVMMVIAIASSDTVVTENYIIRNVGIHKENLNLVESALVMGLQDFMQILDNNPANFEPDLSNTDWINNRTDAWTTGAWYNRGDVSTMLNANNSRDANNPAFLGTLATRGEAANGVLRYAVVGWAPWTFATGGSTSLKMGTGPTWRTGRILGEYVSADAGGADNGNGMLRMELGVRRQW